MLSISKCFVAICETVASQIVNEDLVNASFVCGKVMEFREAVDCHIVSEDQVSANSRSVSMY